MIESTRRSDDASQGKVYGRVEFNLTRGIVFHEAIAGDEKAIAEINTIEAIR